MAGGNELGRNPYCVEREEARIMRTLTFVAGVGPLGWTVIGWVVGLVWAVTALEKPRTTY